MTLPVFQHGGEQGWWWKVAQYLDEAQIALANAMAHDIDEPSQSLALYRKICEGQAILLAIFRAKGLVAGPLVAATQGPTGQLSAAKQPVPAPAVNVQGATGLGASPVVAPTADTGPGRLDAVEAAIGETPVVGGPVVGGPVVGGPVVGGPVVGGPVEASLVEMALVEGVPEMSLSEEDAAVEAGLEGSFVEEVAAVEVVPEASSRHAASDVAAHAEDPLISALARILSGRTGRFRVAAAFAVCGFEPGKASQDQMQRLGRALRTLGWERQRRRVDGSHQYVYVKGTAAERDVDIELSLKPGA